MAINYIKIFGERNSGTNFIERLIEKNCLNINVFSSYYRGGTGWKHGFPNIKYFNKLDNTLFIFVIRDLELWLKSMYNQPYHYKRPQNIRDFINNNLIMEDKRLDHDVNVNPNEKQNILQLRYSKMQKYIDFCDLVRHFVFINLEDIQIKPKKFINFLNLNYQIKISSILNSIPNHTKSNLKNRNRAWNTDIPKELLRTKENIKYEKFVSDLKIDFFYK